ncbi:MAG TPA: hypothetical protein VIK71_04800 [Flavobacteriales bacterium]
MKKILILAMLALPVAGFSQAQLTKPDGADPKVRQARPNIESVEAIYVEIVVSNNEKEGQVIRTQIASEAFEKVTDKESIVQLKELSDKSYKTVPDAMADLASKHFKFVTSYQLVGKDGKPTAHLIFEKRALGKSAREEMERQTAPRPAVTPPAKTK